MRWGEPLEGRGPVVDSLKNSLADEFGGERVGAVRRDTKVVELGGQVGEFFDGGGWRGGERGGGRGG